MNQPDSKTHRPARRLEHLGDFTVTNRVLTIALWAIPVGAVGAGAAFVLLRLIGLITNLIFYQRVQTGLAAPGAGPHQPLVVLFAPVVGGLVVGLMARFGSEKIRGHGMPEAIEAILTGGSRVAPRVAILKPISAAISIGTGGPFGAEGPIIMTGGAVGSVLAQGLRMTADERKTLLVAGAAAGMAATFNAPFASVLLAVELLLFEWRPRSLVPVVAAVVTATILRGQILGTGPLFVMRLGDPHIGFGVDMLCVVTGIVGGLLAVAATALVYLSEDGFRRLPLHWMWWPPIGGLIIGIGGLIEPHALGVGYDVIRALLHGDTAMSLILGILIVKTLIWSLSLGSGTSGGVLAPVFMIGAALGALESQLFPVVGPGFWALMGLAAVVGGVMRSPLTGVVFPLELTHAWPALLALLISAASAYALSALILKRSVLTEKVARRGLHLTREYSVDPLEVLLVEEAMSLEPPVIRADEPASLAPEPVMYSVLDAGDALVGVMPGGPDLPAGRLARELAAPPAVVVHPDDTLRDVANLFAEHDVSAAPVVEREDPARLLGVITLPQLLTGRLRDLQEERHRERLLPLPAPLPLPVRMRPGPNAPSPPRRRGRRSRRARDG